MTSLLRLQRLSTIRERLNVNDLHLGKWISCFKDAIRGKEQEDFSMTGKYARFNDNVKHHDGNWFVATSKLD